jgi:hypothetical protein
MNSSGRIVRLLKKKWLELTCVIIVTTIIFSFTLPRFLTVQKSGQIKRIQQTLDAIIQRMIDRPETFIDITIGEGGAMRDEAASIVNGVAHYGSMYPSFSLKSEGIHKILPDYKPGECEKGLTFHFFGGHISATEEIMRTRNWDWNRHFVMVFVNMNYESTESSPTFKLGAKYPRMFYPAAHQLFDPSNGLGSQGILYAHTYDRYLAENSSGQAGTLPK